MLIISHLLRVKKLRASCALFSRSITYKEDKVKVGKYNINYLQVGNGAHKVLCMPGALGSIWTDFKPQIEGFDKEQFTLIVWEAPGYGKSRPPEKEFPIDFYAQDADAAFDFMKVLDVSRYSLMGWSYGSALSIILAARHPEAVQKMVIWGASTFFLPHEIEAFKNLKDVRKWSDQMRKPMLQLYGEENFSKLWSKAVHATVAMYDANNGNICSELVKKVNCPTFILYGEKDSLVDNIHVSHLHSNIRGSRIHLYPEGKHNIHLRYPDDFNKKVQEFLLQE